MNRYEIRDDKGEKVLTGLISLKEAKIVRRLILKEGNYDFWFDGGWKFDNFYMKAPIFYENKQIWPKVKK